MTTFSGHWDLGAISRIKDYLIYVSVKLSGVLSVTQQGVL